MAAPRCRTDEHRADAASGGRANRLTDGSRRRSAARRVVFSVRQRVRSDSDCDTARPVVTRVGSGIDPGTARWTSVERRKQMVRAERDGRLPRPGPVWSLRELLVRAVGFVLGLLVGEQVEFREVGLDVIV